MSVISAGHSLFHRLGQDVFKVDCKRYALPSGCHYLWRQELLFPAYFSGRCSKLLSMLYGVCCVCSCVHLHKLQEFFNSNTTLASCQAR